MASLIMNEMVSRGFRVGLLTWDSYDAKPHYKLNKNIEWERLNLGNPEHKAGFILRIQRLKRMRNFIQKFKPDVAIGFQVGTFLAARIAMLGMGIPIIAAERNSPDLFDFLSNSSFQRKKAEMALMLADCITVQFESYYKKYPEKHRNLMVAIPNPVTPIQYPAYPNESESLEKIILNVGRLSYQKNQIFLINAFARIAKDYPAWKLILVGDGEKRAEVEALISAKKLNHQVILIGVVSDVHAWYKKAAFLAFPSLWEGFPNALAEAFSQGVPALGFKETAGVNELIQDGITGVLVERNEIDFAEGMSKMLDDWEFRKKAGRKAQESILIYKPENIFQAWELLFRKMIDKNSL